MNRADLLSDLTINKIVKHNELLFICHLINGGLLWSSEVSQGVQVMTLMAV